MIFKPLEFEEFKGNGFDTFKIKMRSNRKNKITFKHNEFDVFNYGRFATIK